MCIRDSSEGDDLVVGGAGWRGMTIYGEGGGSVIQFADNASNRIGQILYNHGDDSMLFRVNGNVDRLIIDSSGRVLIGTNSLHNSNSYSNNLIIYENGDTGMSILGNNSNSNYASLYLSDTSTHVRSYLEATLGANGNFTIGKAGTGKIRYVVNGSEQFCMTHTGRFGVGDNDPDYAIHVKGSVPAVCFEDTDGTHGQSIIEQNDDNLKIRCDAGNASSGSGSNINFQIDGSEHVRITNVGYVAINRTSPSQFLDVDGQSQFRSFMRFGSGGVFHSTAFSGGSAYDTGISVNGYSYGSGMVFIASQNYNAGTGTRAGVYFVKFYYDGNNSAVPTHIAGDNWVTFGKSASNTLTVTFGAGNNMYSYMGNALNI